MSLRLYVLIFLLHDQIRHFFKTFNIFNPGLPTWVGVDWSALKQDRGASIGQRSVDTVTVSCDPADICHAAKHISILVAEDILRIRRELNILIE